MPRYCFTSRVRPEVVDTYRQVHAQVWPEMLQALRDTGWRDYALYLTDDGLLIGTVLADDFDAAREAMARTEVNPRWQEAMSNYFAGGGAPDEGFELVPLVFDLDAELRRHGLPTAAS